MKFYALVNSGMEEVAKTEISELFMTTAKGRDSVLEFESSFENFSKSYLQSVRRIIISLGKYNKLEKINFPEINYHLFFHQGSSFKVEVENVKGQDNRIEIAKLFLNQFYPFLEKQNIQPEINLKKPTLLIVIYFKGKEYFAGLDLHVKELNLRPYRVFAHSGSFKGDLAYFFVRKLGLKKKEKVLVGFCKDGTMAIEAALFLNSKVYAVDESRQNIIAARKNSLLAGTKDLVDFQRYSLEDLDVKFSEQEFDKVIFHLTTKDENKINEVYYQTNYILKKKGGLLVISRAGFELPISEKFSLKTNKCISRGESSYHYWLLEKR